MAHHNLKTLSEVMNILRKRGISREICMTDEKQFILQETDIAYQPTDLSIIKSYRFEGDSNPEDNAVLYVLEDKNGLQSIILDSYGAESNYTGEEFDNFLRNIPINEREDFILE